MFLHVSKVGEMRDVNAEAGVTFGGGETGDFQEFPDARANHNTTLAKEFSSIYTLNQGRTTRQLKEFRRRQSEKEESMVILRSERGKV